MNFVSKPRSFALNVMVLQYIREPCEGLSEQQCSLVLGGWAEQWGETVDTSDIEQTLFPRASAMAERLWSPRPTTGA